jgi:tetratricopeptide (TPR) repeat protein
MIAGGRAGGDRPADGHAVDEAIRLENKRLRPDSQFQYRARDLYVEICQSQARAYSEQRQWEKVVERLLAIDKLHLVFPVEARSRSKEAELRQQEAQAYQDMGFDRLTARDWDGAIGAFEKAESLDKSKARQLNQPLAKAYAERGLDHANCRELPEAVSDLNRALGLYRGAQTYRLCGLACRRMAEDYHEYGLIASEKVQWETAVSCLDDAIRLDRTLEYELRGMLEDAQRNSARLSALPRVTQPKGF